jgi:diadenosine tetraphosphate (Ap4A) HIT family hydrolase
MTNAASDGSCLICDQEDAPAANVVFRDDRWACEITPGFEVPGWVVLRVRRHVLGWPGLDEDELATVGRRIRDVVSAAAEVTGAPKVYVMTFGEAYPHFHALIVPRGDEVPPEMRTARILEQRERGIDVDAAHELIPQLRASYELRTGRRRP